jgi:transmembrane protein DUF3566
VTDPRTSGSGPSPDLHANGVEPATGRFGGFAVTSVDDVSAPDEDGYDWHAPQTLAPRYGEESGAESAQPDPSYQQSAQAWWDQVRAGAGAGAVTGPGSGEHPAEPAGYAGISTENDHTASISHVPPSVAPAPQPEPAPEFVPAYNGGGYDDQRWSQQPANGYAATTTNQPHVDDRAPLPDRSSSAGPRRAKLSLRRIDPWSTLKFTLVLSVALFVVWMVAVGVLYGVLSGMGVWDKINSTVNEVNGSNGKTVTPQIVLGIAGVIGGVSIVLFTALATIGSFIYNLCADMVGGLEVTLAERD